MNKKEQELFDKAIEEFSKGDIESFAKSLVTLVDLYITCGCFLGSQPKEVWKTLKLQTQSIPDNLENFSDNLSKGFIYLHSKNLINAYEYLSIAISLDPLNDIPYYLRACIDSDNNPQRVLDAQKAVSLKPNARNYFKLAGIVKTENNEINCREALFYYQQAISNNNEFACAYYWKAILHKSLQELDKAVECFERCIQLNENHWCYYELWQCLTKLEMHDKALVVATNGLEKHKSNIDYHSALALTNYNLKNYSDAVSHAEIILKENPDNKWAKKNLHPFRNSLQSSLLVSATGSYEKNDYFKAFHHFGKYMSNGGVLSEKDSTSYLISLLKLIKGIELNETNESYKLFLNLRNSYSQKVENGLEFTSDEENAAFLICYKANYRLGFGEHEGQTIEQLISSEPDYIIWCIINLYHFSIENKLLINESLKYRRQYLISVEINLIKNNLIEKERNKKMESEDDDFPDYDLSDYYNKEARNIQFESLRAWNAIHYGPDYDD